MKRTVLVVILAVAALALLVAFALQSRSVPVELHVAQHTVSTETARVGEDFVTLVDTLTSAWRDVESPSAAAVALQTRVAASPDLLRSSVLQIPGSRSQRTRIQNGFDGFVSTVDETATLASELIADQTAFVESVAYLRDIGPQVIQQMRDIRLDRVAADSFQLIVGAVDYARPDSRVQDYELRRLLVTLGRDQRIDANMPVAVDRLLSAVTRVLDTKGTIRSRLEQLQDTPLVASANALDLAVGETYRTAVSAVDRARLMLSIYAIVLLVAVGIAVFSLQNSYRDLNSANQKLMGLNESLEHRVAERTHELEGTLSDLKESQVQLVQAEKMSSLGQLVAGISHEINTPLLYLANNATLIQERIDLLQNFIESCADVFRLKPENFVTRAEYQTRFVDALRDLKRLLRDDELEANVDEVRDLVRDSIEGLGDLTEMAQSLKDFSRLDRAPVGRFDVNTGLDKTLVIARNIVKHKAEVHKFYGDVPEIECSPSQINQVFLNLITNAAQAIDGQGEIVITTKLAADQQHVTIAISDTGCGIPEENLAKIRDPFFTTKEVGTGTGLGLSIVDEIVRGHGGQLLVESRLGHGSTFTVLLPIRQPSVTITDPAVDDTDEPAFAEAV
jgi:two-component system, NtrC family, sensor kinase